MPVKCYKCSKAFKDNRDLRRHIGNVHNKERPYKCELCAVPKFFGQKHHLNKHVMSKHTGERPFPCPINGCPMGVVTQYELNEHLGSSRHLEAAVKQFKCRLCPESFNTTYARNQHKMRACQMRVPGAAVKWFKCRQCSEPFNTNYARKKHEMRFCPMRPDAQEADAP